MARAEMNVKKFSFIILSVELNLTCVGLSAKPACQIKSSASVSLDSFLVCVPDYILHHFSL